MMPSQTMRTQGTAPFSANFISTPRNRVAARRALKWRRLFRTTLSVSEGVAVAGTFTGALALGIFVVLMLGGVLGP